MKLFDKTNIVVFVFIVDFILNLDQIPCLVYVLSLPVKEVGRNHLAYIVNHISTWLRKLTIVRNSE